MFILSSHRIHFDFDPTEEHSKEVTFYLYTTKYKNS